MQYKDTPHYKTDIDQQSKFDESKFKTEHEATAKFKDADSSSKKSNSDTDETELIKAIQKEEHLEESLCLYQHEYKRERGVSFFSSS